VIAMKAIVQDTYGSADVLRLGDIPRPDIRDDEVLVKVVAAGVDRGALHLMSGEPRLMRILGFGLRAPKSSVPGTNIAGVVEAVGKDVTRFDVGAQVYGTCPGAWAEYARASEDKIAAKPTALTFEEAAVVPYGAIAAWQAVHDHGHLHRGEQALVVGVTGAVGSLAAQFAKAAGAEVTGVCSTRSAALARSLGVDHVVDYTREDFAKGSRRYDLIIDVFGRSPLSRMRRALTRHGRLVIVGGEGGDRWTGGLQRQLAATLLSPLVPQNLGTFVAKENARFLEQVNQVIEAGNAKPIMDGTYLLTEAAEAVRHVQSGQSSGRIAITI
jgi:NADPH:quinone reductase-like Zn-dependent oxidoreductase